mgnify:FL=1
MLNNVNININLEKEKYIIIGCSSGPDSMALLHYLKNNTQKKIVCAHINHNKRKESKEEELYLKNYCQKNDIIFECKKIKSYNENNFENEARNKRYHFYEEILKKYNTKYIFLAHHGDDLIETILMKINHGSTLEGYAGIKEIVKHNDYYIVRPFLKYTKKDLIDYNKKNNIKYYIDKSNFDNNYTRNRIRNQILPLLKSENENIHAQFLKFSKTLLEYNNYINKITDNYLNKLYKNKKLDISNFDKIDHLIQKNIIFSILTKYYSNKPNIIKEKNITDIINMINNNKPNLIIDLPKNSICQKEYNTISIKQKEEKINYKIKLQNITTVNNITIIKVNEEIDDGNDICRLNSKDIKLPLYLRNRKNGDYIEIKGLNGKKKIKDIFIDKKIPITLRDKYPLLVDDNDSILWIPNIKKSKFNRPKEQFCDIILKYCEKEENYEQKNS